MDIEYRICSKIFSCIETALKQNSTGQIDSLNIDNLKTDYLSVLYYSA